MTITEIYEYIKRSAEEKVGVESVYLTEPYNSWNVVEVRYGSVCIFIDSVQIDKQERKYRINLYYGDILTETADNLFSVQNTAVEILSAIIKDLGAIEGVYMNNSVDINLFKQKFTDILAGGYCSFMLNERISTCPKINKY